MLDCIDGSDEESCTSPICGPDGFHCGFQTCIPSSMRCDGLSQCPNLADEQNCVSIEQHSCLSNEFKCPDDPNTCLPNWKICNNQLDCYDGSDESQCLKCSSQQWKCLNTDKCIHRSNLCDGSCQCSDLSDETVCSTMFNCYSYSIFNVFEHFVPLNRGGCIPTVLLCDGVPDCWNFADEQNCRNFPI